MQCRSFLYIKRKKNFSGNWTGKKGVILPQQLEEIPKTLKEIAAIALSIIDKEYVC